MGLEIFYDLHAPASWNASKVRRVVEAARKHALTLGFAEVNEVIRNDPKHPRTMGVKRPPKDADFVRAEAIDGWFFRSWPGERCETAIFGLCKFPPRVSVGDRSVAFGWGDGWHFHTWCKTQYAEMVSRAHFLKCHLGVIWVLDFFRSEGCRVAVRDGGDYWKSRRIERLIKRLEEMHARVAAVAGAFKDASEGSGGQVVSPIVEHPRFEKLEAEGLSLFQQRRKPRRKQNPQK